MEDLDFLVDVTISKVYEGKSGESQYGKWTAYNFYVDGDDRKFSYFKTEKSPLLPATGMSLKMLRFETKEKDGYTNHNVKEMFLNKTGTTAQKPSVATGSTISPKRDSSITMFVSYSKDLMVALIGQGRYIEHELEDIVAIVAQVGIIMYDKINNPVRDKPEKSSEGQDLGLENLYMDGDDPAYSSDEPPIGEPPPY